MNVRLDKKEMRIADRFGICLLEVQEGLPTNDEQFAQEDKKRVLTVDQMRLEVPLSFLAAHQGLIYLWRALNNDQTCEQDLGIGSTDHGTLE